MPILELNLNARTLQRDCFNCTTIGTVDTDCLLLGKTGKLDVNLIEMPPCSCGSIEAYSRTFDEMPKELLGIVADLHRRAVNLLAQTLKSMGRSHPDCAAAHAAETKEPPDMAKGPIVVVPAMKRPTNGE